MKRFLVVRAPSLQETATGFEGPNSPGTVASDNAVGTKAWSNPSNAKASDDSRASAEINTEAVSEYLKATNFEFAIPESSTVVGILVEVEKQSNSGLCHDYRARIVKGGTIGSTDRSSAAEWPKGVDAYVSYGSDTDLWGETWAPADINGATFGFAISAKGGVAGLTTAYVDHIRITAYYTEAGVNNTVCSASQSLEIRSDAIEREDATGSFWTPPPFARGSKFYLDPEGSAGLVNRIAVRMRRNDTAVEPDTNPTDKQTLRIWKRERFLTPR
jgi:hypothetical protein